MDIKKENTSQEQSQTITETKKHHNVWIGSYVLLAIICLALHFVFRLAAFDTFKEYRPLLKKIFLGSFFIFTVLSISRYSQVLLIKYTHGKALRYNLIRLVRIASLLALFMIVIAFFFENWYTAAVSLGLISLVLGFALQTPISSFIGWLYIIIRNPYKVGDRIQLGDFKGDVVEIGYLDTTLWEFAGDYLTNDLPSGRLIRFPNTMVLQSEVYNYSWRKFPYIWNEIPFHIAYESDFAYVETVLRDVAKTELGPEMDEKVKELKLLIQETAVDELVIKEYPFVTFRTNANTWVEASINYLVDPKKATSTRSHIIKKAIKKLLEEPDKVMFPKTNSR